MLLKQMVKNYNYVLNVFCGKHVVCELSKGGSKMREKKARDTSVNVWMSQVNSTDTGMEKGLEQQSSVYFGDDVGSDLERIISIDETNTYQEMDGFGISLTEASAHLYQNVLADADKASLMNAMFSDDGISLNLLRQTIGASDHCVAPYTFAPEEQGVDLPYFDMSHEFEEIFPSVLDAVATASRGIKIIASCWSPPGWLKENDSELGMYNGIRGSLRSNHYQTYANYLLKFVEGYKNNGVDIEYITVCNEPDHASYDWPALPMRVEEQIALVNQNLYQTFQDSGLNVGIMAWDHSYTTDNYPNGEFAFNYLADESARDRAVGTAWHWYEGREETMLRVHKRYPEKGIWFTEGSGGEWQYPKWQVAFFNQTKCVINIMRNWCKSIIFWNLALDENGGPDYYYVTNQGNHSTNRGLVTIHQEMQNWFYNVDYYTLGHASKFIRPGAVRIDSNTLREDIETVALKNPDGSKVLLMSNQTLEEKMVKIVWGDQYLDYLLPEGAMVTMRWEGEQSGRTKTPFWYNNFEETDNFDAGIDAEVEKIELTENDLLANVNSFNCLKLTVTENGDPQYGTQCVIIRPGDGVAVDTRGFEYLVFSIRDMVNPAGSTVKVTLVDADGNYGSTWTDENTHYESWTRIWFAMGQISGVDRSRITEIHLAEYWRGDYYVDDLSFALGYIDDIPALRGNLVVNPSFENDGSPTPTPVGWVTTGSVEKVFHLDEDSNSKSGRFHAVHHALAAPWFAYTSQVIENLEEGVYNLEAWTQSSQGNIEAKMILTGFDGGTTLEVDIPVGTDWSKVEISNVTISSGSAEIAFYTIGQSNTWTVFDNVKFYKQ